jgi:hypothetical protein
MEITSMFGEDVSEPRQPPGLLFISMWCTSMDSHDGMISTGERRRTWRKTCLGATLSTTYPTWIDPGTNPGLRSKRPATNRLGRCTACWYHWQFHFCSSSLVLVGLFIVAWIACFQVRMSIFRKYMFLSVLAQLPVASLLQNVAMLPWTAVSLHADLKTLSGRRFNKS